ncbi:hypothetical protein K438DRAFT_1771071 [Mycena galopus ATCC 62051]|nr:hypothetical protein K438DRAFT_1771071 [Mycena galopus ATCC 62051]
MRAVLRMLQLGLLFALAAAEDRTTEAGEAQIYSYPPVAAALDQFPPIWTPVVSIRHGLAARGSARRHGRAPDLRSNGGVGCYVYIVYIVFRANASTYRRVLPRGGRPHLTSPAAGGGGGGVRSSRREGRCAHECALRGILSGSWVAESGAVHRALGVVCRAYVWSVGLVLHLGTCFGYSCSASRHRGNSQSQPKQMSNPRAFGYWRLVKCEMRF